MKIKVFSLISALLLIVCFESCTHRVADFTVVSSKNFPIFDSNNNYEKAPVRVTGVDRSHIILFIPIGSPDLKEAIDKAIEKHPNAIGLYDAVVKSSFWDAILYGQSSYIVEGTPIVLKKGATVDVDNLKSESTGSIMFYHDVKQGDTLASIASQYGVSVGDIVKWNKLSSNTLSQGTKLLIYLKN